MMYYFLALLLLLCGCSHKTDHTPDEIATIQLVDRNGFSETISAKHRLEPFLNVDFSKAQSYQKVTRIYGRSHDGKLKTKINTYHANGQPWQYLEIENGRAHGKYLEWYASGLPRIEALVIEGIAEVSELAMASWLFHEICHVWDEEGNPLAEISYEKGELEGPSLYYTHGKLTQEIPYHKDGIDGTVKIYDESGALVETLSYKQGLKHGTSEGKYYKEEYQKDLLLTGTYLDAESQILSEIKDGNGRQAIFEKDVLTSFVQHVAGKPEGKVELLDDKGELKGYYTIKDGKKEGEEWEYYSDKQPRLCVPWKDDAIQGVVRTWYENGVLESQREMAANKKQGLSFAWYKEGDLMLMEEYENDSLVKGSYYKKWEKNPTSRVDNGKGTATIFDNDGHFLHKISYEKGLPKPD
ncbi:MAG: hypothetical protein JSR58_01615 [Verrucomicrobia bacterium]|nr:hypothetical protein [Verrucomicrobiota bacterium]